VIRGAEVIERRVGNIDSYVGDMQRRVSVLHEVVERQAGVESELCKLMRKLGRRVDDIGGRIGGLESRIEERLNALATQDVLMQVRGFIGHDSDHEGYPTLYGRLDRLRRGVGDRDDDAGSVHDRLRTLEHPDAGVARASKLRDLQEAVGTSADGEEAPTLHGRLNRLAATSPTGGGDASAAAAIAAAYSGWPSEALDFLRITDYGRTRIHAILSAAIYSAAMKGPGHIHQVKASLNGGRRE
jgi:hypothetical protein